MVRLEKGQFDLELFASALGLVVVLGVGALRWLPAQYLPLPHCTFHTVTGQPCLTCGGTRAATALAHLDFATALSKNPLVALGLTLAGPVALAGLAAWLFKWPRPRLEIESRAEKRWLWVAGLLAVAANWTYLIVVGI